MDYIEDRGRKNKSNLIIAVLFAVLISFVFFLSFAIFTQTTVGGANSIKTGSITMSYSEPSSAMVIEEAVPLSDVAGQAQIEYFQFNVSSRATTNASDSIGVTIPYEVNIKSRPVVGDAIAFANSDIKIHLAEVISGSETEVTGATLISSLASSTLNTGSFVVFSTSDLHKNNSVATVRTYRLRAWIRNDFNTLLLEDDTYEYRFIVNVNAHVSPLS